MKKILTTTLFLAIAMAALCQNSSTNISGIFTGKNVYIKNPKSSTSDDYCIYNVMVNGAEIYAEMKSTAFSIDLASLKLGITDSIHIVLEHESGCTPYVINPGAISSISSCVIDEIYLSKGGSLQWSTVNESGNRPFIIEQFKWNRWVKIGEVTGKGQKENNNYSFMFDMHTGNNTLRIKQVDGKIINTSKQISMESIKEEPVTIKNTIVKNTLAFSEETAFEIWNEYGILLISEFGSEIDLTELEEGIYYVNYGSTAGTKITKK